MRYLLAIWKARRPLNSGEGWEAMRRELSVLYSRFCKLPPPFATIRFINDGNSLIKSLFFSVGNRVDAEVDMWIFLLSSLCPPNHHRNYETVAIILGAILTCGIGTDGFLLGGILIMYELHTILRYILILFYSFWIPQIVANMVRDSRKPLHPHYILGMTFTRLAIPLYTFGCPRNFMRVETSSRWCIGLTVFMCSQAAVLLLQHYMGARCFIPRQVSLHLMEGNSVKKKNEEPKKKRKMRKKILSLIVFFLFN